MASNFPDDSLESCESSLKEIDFIKLIPLESRDIDPPPEELSRVLHFGDWTLAYKRTKN